MSSASYRGIHRGQPLDSSPRHRRPLKLPPWPPPEEEESDEKDRFIGLQKEIDLIRKYIGRLDEIGDLYADNPAVTFAVIRAMHLAASSLARLTDLHDELAFLNKDDKNDPLHLLARAIHEKMAGFEDDSAPAGSSSSLIPPFKFSEQPSRAQPAPPQAPPMPSYPSPDPSLASYPPDTNAPEPDSAFYPAADRSRKF